MLMFMVLGGMVLEIWPLKGGASLHEAFSRLSPHKIQIAAIRKRNGVRVSNFQNFLVLMISTSVLNKKKIKSMLYGVHPCLSWAGMTPLFLL